MSPAGTGAGSPDAQQDPPFIGRERQPWEAPPSGWRTHQLAVWLGLIAAVALLGGALFWAVASRGGCDDRVVCVINANGGLTTLYGLLLTASGLGLTLVLRSVDDESEHERFLRIRRQAVYEAWHNLQHIASSWEESGRLRNRGDLALDRATELAGGTLAKWLSPSQAEFVDHMRRNVAVLQRLDWNDASDAAADHVRWFAEQALRFVVDVGRDDPVARQMPARFQVAAGRDRAEVIAPLERLGEWLARPGRRWAVTFSLTAPLSAADPARCNVVCWTCSVAQPGPETVHELGRSLCGLADPP